MTEVFTVEVEDLSEEYCGCHWSNAKKSYGLFSTVWLALEFVLDKDKPFIKEVLGGEDWLLSEPQMSWPDNDSDVLSREYIHKGPEAVTFTVKDTRFREDPHKLLMIIDIKKVEVTGE